MEEKKYSGLGIASFITSIVSGILIFLLFVIAGIMEASTPGGMDEESVGAVMVGLFLFVFLGATMIALGLGIAGFFQKERKQIFSILGTVFSVVSLVVTIFIMILGMAIG